MKKYKGFTLIELLIAIGIIVILSGVVIIALNPQEQLEKSRNGQRKAHIEALYGAVEHYIFQEGEVPACITTTASDITNCVAVIVPTYMTEIPKDPVCGNGDSGYLVKKNALGEVGVRADCAEGGEEITAGTW